MAKPQNAQRKDIRDDDRALQRRDRRRRKVRGRRRLSPDPAGRIGTSFVVLEAQDSFGGTWLTHRYPGIRSDSDLYTFGYRFKPWTGAPIATAAEILSYMGEVIDENDLAHHIRYRHKITRASWSSAVKLVDITPFTKHPYPANASALPQTSCGCAGGTTALAGLHPRMGRDRGLPGPDRPPAGMARGPRLRPQEGGRHRIGRHRGDAHSGNRPRIRNRSRCCSARRPGFEPAAMRSRSPMSCANSTSTKPGIHEIVRKKILHDQAVFTGRSFTEPEAVKRELLAAVRGYLGSDYDVGTYPFHAEVLAGRGGSASPLFPTATYSKPSAPARCVSSPTRSSGLPRPAFCCGRAKISMPTSSSPPPALTSMCSATSTLPSTASRSSSRTRSPIAA